MDYVCLSHTVGGFANINYADSTPYIRTSEIYAEIFISLHQLVTKNQIQNAKLLCFYFCCNSKENRLSLGLSFWIATTTKIKARKFCISYQVFSRWQMQRNKHKNEKKMNTCPCFSSFPSTQLHTSVLVSKCWLVLESRYIRHVSMQQAWSLVWPHIFVKFYRTILYDQNQKVPW